MNKAELVSEIAIKAGLNKREAGLALDAFLQTVEEAVGKKEKVNIKGFGSFEARVKKARKARNPVTKEEIELSETVVPVFKAGDKFKKTVQGEIEER